MLYLNGKFVAQQLSGVQRVAWRLLEALDENAPCIPEPCVLLCPHSHRLPKLRYIEVRPVGPARLNLHLWEQCVLPWHARDGLLLSLIGSAPWFGGRLACMIHDAAVFENPQAYTSAFVQWYRRLFMRTARRAEQLFTVSEHAQLRLAAHLGVPTAQITVIPNGADHLMSVTPRASLVHELGLTDKPFFLAVASANPAKNIERLVEAFARLDARHDVRLIIVGGGNRRVYARQGATAATLDPRIHHIGPADDAALRTLYGEAVALVFPSLYEGFGLPPAEAMACGCPVITSGIPPMTQVCGPAAAYVNPRDPASIAAAMEALLLAPQRRAEMRAAGLFRARDYTWATAGRRLLGALRLGGPRAVIRHPEGAA